MSNSLVVIYAIVLQFITAMFLLALQEPVKVASLGIFYDAFAIPQFGAFLILVGVILATIGVNFQTKNGLKFLFFLPQYLFLLLTSGSALHYIVQGSYADGVIRPWSFIFIDQLHSLLIVLFYTLAIFDFRKEKYGTTIGKTSIKK